MHKQKDEWGWWNEMIKKEVGEIQGDAAKIKGQLRGTMETWHQTSNKCFTQQWYPTP